MLLVAGCGGVSRPEVGWPVGGTITAAIRMAAGTLTMEADRIWPIAAGTTGARITPYRAITVPAMPAMPHVMTMKSSPRLITPRYGRTTSGASTMPTKMFAAADSPTAPPIPIARSSTRDSARTIAGRIFQ
jgi:hypothetical protein